MILDRTTYEAWLLDRIEGNLTPEQERELDAFLEANPDLSTVAGELPGVSSDETSIDWKNELKKTFPPVGEIDASRLTQFLVALHEGDLPGPQAMDLERYLYEHPEAAREVRLMNASRVLPAEGMVPDDHVAFPEKGSIGRHFPPQGLPDKHRLTDFLIAALEGDLTKEQRAALVAYVKSYPEAQREERLVAAARMQPEPVVFSGKEQLKKREGRVIALWQRYAVAASIALLLGFTLWMTRNEGTDGPVIAKTEKVKPDGPQGPEQPSPGRFGSQGAETLRESVVPQGPEQPSPERFGSQGAETLREKGKSEKEEQAPTPIEHIAPVPEQQLDNGTEQPGEEHTPAPLVAQDLVAPPAMDLHPQEPIEVAAPATFAAAARPSDGGTPAGTALANAVRGGVIDSEKRDASLDGDDALAMVNKGLGAMTGGQGRVQVERGGARERWKLRLGRNLAISASRGR